MRSALTHLKCEVEEPHSSGHQMNGPGPPGTCGINARVGGLKSLPLDLNALNSTWLTVETGWESRNVTLLVQASMERGKGPHKALPLPDPRLTQACDLVEGYVYWL